MALINHSVNNLIQGVSQQSPAVRLDNQLEEQVNLVSDVAKGLILRNGLELTTRSNDIDLEKSHMIEFSVDGRKHVIALDNTVLQGGLHYIPMSADLDTLSTNISNPAYFNGMEKGSLKILEDKDHVYLVNTDAVTAELGDASTFFDITIKNNVFELSDDWTLGSYTFQVSSRSATEGPTSFPFVVDRNTTLVDLSDMLNNDLNLLDKCGPSFIEGVNENYRVTFFDVPEGYLSPTAFAVSATPMLKANLESQESEYIHDTFNRVYKTDWQGVNQFVWNGAYLGQSSGDNLFASDGNLYYKGSPMGLDQNLNATYSIKQITEVEVYDPYYISLVASTAYNEEPPNLVAKSGMIWVTGVSSEQTYSGSVKYRDTGSQTPEQILSVNFSVPDVGVNPSHININWVAGEIRNDIGASPVFTAVSFDNAVYFYCGVNTDYVIEDIEVTNNYDNTSISGVVEASLTNDVGFINIDLLPAKFQNGFQFRVGTTESDDANYYLEYNSSFKGWKENSLNVNRGLDNTRMPHIISKDKVRRNKQILIEPHTWDNALSGDTISNPKPTFAGKKINDMFFYGSRLGIATDDTIVMSAIDSLGQFYRTTNSTVTGSDRVDIKLDSSKTGFNPIQSVTTLDQKLFLNTGPTQSVLLVNNSFDLSKARLSQVSAYTLGDNTPVSVENGLYFHSNVGGVTTVTDYALAGNAFVASELNKHCPTYLKGTVANMVYHKGLAVLSMEEDKKTLYVQNRFSEGGQTLQNAWHKWEVPYDVEYLHFDNDELYVTMTTEVDSVKTVLVGKYDVRPRDPIEIEEGAVRINWIPYLDLNTKDKSLIEDLPEFSGVNTDTGVSFNTVDDAYDSTMHTQVEISDPTLEVIDGSHYWRVQGNLNFLTFGFGVPITFGNNTIDTWDSGAGTIRYFKGEFAYNDGYGSDYYKISSANRLETTEQTDNMLYGIRYTGKCVLSKILPKVNSEGNSVVMNYAKLMLRKMRLFLAFTGPFNVSVNFLDRKDYTIESNTANVGSLKVGAGVASDGIYNFPINGKSDLVEITLSTDSATPFNLLVTEWQGQIITKGRNV